MLDPATAARLHRQLAELPEILTHAYLALLPSTTAARAGRVSGATRTPPLPVHLDTLDALTDPTSPSVDILEAWAAAVLDDRARANDWSAWARLPTIPGELPASVAIKILRFHAPFAARRAYAADLATEIDALHTHLNRTARYPIKSARPTRTPCPACQLRALCERTDGWRECLHCREQFSPTDYASRVKQLLAELRHAA
ncbi:hypothetical protein ACFVFS_05695 [Kitasatospora sp. NPDC057692]|uniref:hypothetical protein n=1 Tax=Kitasatospora sp. NPDC057692 TaxID=3346215 RepID=UPI0036912E4C